MASYKIAMDVVGVGKIIELLNEKQEEKDLYAEAALKIAINQIDAGHPGWGKVAEDSIGILKSYGLSTAEALAAFSELLKKLMNAQEECEEDY